jgi:hypothetical protein
MPTARDQLIRQPGRFYDDPESDRLLNEERAELIERVCPPEEPMRKRKWHGVCGHVFVECQVPEENPSAGWVDIDERRLPSVVPPILGRVIPAETWCVLVIHFRSSGYYDPGVISGPPERCYPPEGDDERTLDYAELEIGRPAEPLYVRLTAADAVAVFEAFRRQIEAADLDEPDDEPPDHEDDLDRTARRGED